MGTSPRGKSKIFIQSLKGLTSQADPDGNELKLQQSEQIRNRLQQPEQIFSGAVLLFVSPVTSFWAISSTIKLYSLKIFERRALIDYALIE